VVIPTTPNNYNPAMGFYYEQQPAPDEEKPPGCLDALLITRAVFGVLFWPMLAIFAVLLDIAVTFYLFTVHPALALIPIALTGVVLWLFARWEQQRFRPPDL
jgi:hypothetical protein